MVASRLVALFIVVVAAGTAMAAPMPLAFSGADAEHKGAGASWLAGTTPMTDSIRVCAEPLAQMQIANTATLASLGGNYAPTSHRTNKSFGHQGACWVEGTIELASVAFKAQRFVSLRARGEGTIELRLTTNNAVLASFALAGPTATPLIFEPMRDVQLDLGASSATVRLVMKPTTNKAIHIDDVRTHAAAAAPRVPDKAFKDRGSRAWGFADVHVHISSHQAMGGLQGNRTLWGVPGGDASTYAASPNSVWSDIPRCNGYHHRDGATLTSNPFDGYLGAGLIGAMSGRTVTGLDDLDQMFNHETGGANVKRTRHALDGFHQQHHITAMRRAYLGGLRLFSALANHSEFMELIEGRVLQDANGKFIQLTDELDLVRAHVCFVMEMAALNSSWMEVAFSADDAQRIIASNKLAVIIGLELPDTGHLIPNTTPEQEVDALFKLGIRQITIIHGADNRLGGTQVFQDVYEWFTDLLWTGIDSNHRVRRNSITVSATKFRGIETREGGCGASGDYKGVRGECVLWNLGRMNLRGVVASLGELGAQLFPIVLVASITVSATVGSLVPFIAPALGVGLAFLGPLAVIAVAVLPLVYAAILASPLGQTPTGLVAPPADFLARLPAMKVAMKNRVSEGFGHLNKTGLLPRGRLYLRAMMARGMLIDLAHASDLSTLDAFEESRRFAHKLGGICQERIDTYKKALSLLDSSPADCFDSAYPLLVSHAQFRAQSIHKLIDADSVDEFMKTTPRPVATTVQNFAPREFEMADHQLKWFRRIGGVVGVFMGQEVLDVPFAQQGTIVTNNCANSTTTFAIGYAYAQRMLGERGVALSSDATYHPMVGPRFGADACTHPDVTDAEKKLNPSFYRPDLQKNGVVYNFNQPSTISLHPSQPPLIPYREGTIVWNFNVDGWANYGAVPDLLQDTVNVGGKSLMPTIFESAQDYVDAWSKATRLARCTSAGGKCVDTAPVPPADCRAACNGTCPGDVRFGAPQPVEASKCGDLNQRACCIGEGKTCRPGLVEQGSCTGNCRCSSGIGSSIGMCKPLTPCGGPDQRACCVLEKVPACNAGLGEQGSCAKELGDCTCKAGGASIGVCRSITKCGGDGQRACCVLEKVPACGPGLLEQGSCPNEIGGCMCQMGGWSIGVCHPPRTPCGGLNERACCLGEGIPVGAPACRDNLVEKGPCVGDCQCTGSILSSQGMCRKP